MNEQEPQWLSDDEWETLQQARVVFEKAGFPELAMRLQALQVRHQKPVDVTPEDIGDVLKGMERALKKSAGEDHG